MNVLFVTSECYPLAISGGLGDVVGSLPSYLNDIGENCRVLMPGYPQAIKALEKKGKPIKLGDPFGLGDISLLPGELPNGVKVWLIIAGMYDREGDLYGYNGEDYGDNHYRFSLLCRVASHIAVIGRYIGFEVDMFHVNDWQASLTPVYYSQTGNKFIPTLLTIHNIKYKGLYDIHRCTELGIQSEFLYNQCEYYNNLSFLKAGIEFATYINVVSPTYAGEIQRPEFGYGFEGLMQRHSYKLCGILNGINCNHWNPLDDKFIDHKLTNIKRITSFKDKNKMSLQKKLGLKVDKSIPLFVCVSRLAHQKGIDIILQQAEQIIHNGGQLAILGNGDKHLEYLCHAKAMYYPDQMSFNNLFDQKIAHQLYASGDFLLMPSRFEPCGLSQMYALRYGTIPIVNATGGLEDSIIDIFDQNFGYGIKFHNPNAYSLSLALERAFNVYKDTVGFEVIRYRAMKQDFSWHKSAQDYQNVYNHMKYLY